MSDYRCDEPTCVSNTGGAWDGYCGNCEAYYETCTRCKGYYAEQYGPTPILGGICGNCADDLREDAKYEAAMREPA